MKRLDDLLAEPVCAQARDPSRVPVAGQAPARARVLPVLGIGGCSATVPRGCPAAVGSQRQRAFLTISAAFQHAVDELLQHIIAQYINGWPSS